MNSTGGIKLKVSHFLGVWLRDFKKKDIALLVKCYNSIFTLVPESDNLWVQRAWYYRA
jgi:hypothetical protein